MSPELRRVLDLLRLAVDPAASLEEGRTAAFAAAKLISKHRLRVVDVETEPAPQPQPQPQPTATPSGRAATERQRVVLRRHGLRVDMSFDEARVVISAIERAGWRVPNEIRSKYGVHASA